MCGIAVSTNEAYTSAPFREKALDVSTPNDFAADRDIASVSFVVRGHQGVVMPAKPLKVALIRSGYLRTCVGNG